MTPYLIEQLSAYAESLRRSLGGRNAVGPGGTVHAVGSTRWLADVRVPAPVCHAGFSGGEIAALRPTDDPVSCVRCLRTRPVVRGPAEPTLF